MRFLFVITSFLFIACALQAQQIDTTKHGLDAKHPGTLITINEDFPGSPFDGYNLYVPKSCKISREKYPAIIFLHGGSLVGGEVDSVLDWDLPKTILEKSELKSELDQLLRDTFVVVAPHISHGEFYQGEEAIRTIIARIIQNENVDPNRIYLTGLSRGGYGTWGLASRMSDVFAAAAPICGGGGGIDDYNSLEDFPLWVSHNTNDGVVPYRASERVVERLEVMFDKGFHPSTSISSTNYTKHSLIFTSTPNDSHDAWTEMYSNKNFFKWLLRFKRK